jgi:hypothetical protein
MVMADQGGTPLLDTMTAMTRASLDHARLPDREVLLVRLACLVATDAPRASYAYNLTGMGGPVLTAAEALGYPISVPDQMARGQL